MVQTQFNLLWDSHKSSLCNGFSNLQQNGEFVDMTIAADGHFVKVHQMVIALASPYLKELITSAPCQHPVIFLNNVSHTTLCSVLEYIYTGEVLLPAERLSTFVETAKSLHIKGLESMSSSSEYPPARTGPSISTTLDVPILKSEQSTPLIRKVIVKPEPSETSAAQSLQSRSVIMPANVIPEYIIPDDPAQDSDEGQHFGNQTQLEPQVPAVVDRSAEKISSNLQFTVSIRGSLQVILNRYIYNLHSVTRRTGVRRWRCVDYRNHKCMAYVVSKKNVVLSRANFHNHHFHDRKILSKIEKNVIYSTLDDVEGYKDKPPTDDTNKDDSSMETDGDYLSLDFSDDN